MFSNTLLFGEPDCSVLVKMTAVLGLEPDLFHWDFFIQLLLNRETSQTENAHPDVTGSWLASVC